jgi:hypothetical protein
MRFVPFRPLKDALRTVVVGALGPSDGAGGVLGAPRRRPPTAATPPPVVTVPRRRSLTRGSGSDDGSSGGVLAELTRRVRRTFSGRTINDAPLEEEEGEGGEADAASSEGGSMRGAAAAATAAPPSPSTSLRAPAEEDVAAAAAAALERATTLSIYGLWDGKVFADAAPLGVGAAVARAAATPLPTPAGVPRRPSLPPPPPGAPRGVAPAPPARVLLYDDAAHVATRPLTCSGSAAPLSRALKSPACMVQGVLWSAIVDALRGAVACGACGGNPAVRERLWGWLQREGPQVSAAKRVPGARRAQEYAACWLVATLPNTHAPPALEHPRQRARALMPPPPPPPPPSSDVDDDDEYDDASD